MASCLAELLLCLLAVVVAPGFSEGKRVRKALSVLSPSAREVVESEAAQRQLATAAGNATFKALPLEPALPPDFTFPATLSLASAGPAAVVTLLVLGISYWMLRENSKRVAVQQVPSIGALTRRILEIAVPTSLGNLLFMINETVNLVMLGHAGSTAEIAAVGLGNMMQNCFGLIIGIGLTTALDTLASQASGSGRGDLSAYYLQRCRCILTVQLIWMIPLLFCSEYLLVLVGQDPEVAAFAGRYNQISCFGLFFFFNMYCALSWLRSRDESSMPVLIWVIVICIHVPSCFLWVVVLGLGNAGCGLANLISWTLGCFAMNFYCVRVARRQGISVKSVVWIEAEGLRGWGEFLQLGVPATVQTCTEMWYFEIIIFLTGYLGKVQLAAFVSSYNVYCLVCMPSLGMATGVSIAVGNAIGANRVIEARRTMMTGLGLAWAMAAALSVLIYVLRYPIAWFFSSHADIQTVMANILIVMAATGICDFCQSTISGVLRALYRPTAVVVGFVACFWVVGLLAGALLQHYIGVYGWACALMVGSSLAAIFFGVILLRTDIDAVAVEMEERMAKEQRLKPVPSVPLQDEAAPVVQ